MLSSMRPLAILLLLIIPANASAQIPVVTFPPGEDRIVAVKKGDPTPYDGQLFDTNTAIRWGNWMQQYQVRLKLDVETQKALDAAQISYLNEVIKLERQRYTTVTDDYQKRIHALEAPTPWYGTQTFSFVMGALCMAGVFALSAWAIGEAK